MNQFITPFVAALATSFILFTLFRFSVSSRRNLPPILVDLGIAIGCVFFWSELNPIMTFLVGFAGPLLARFIIKGASRS